MGTIVVSVILVVMVGIAIRSIIRDVKSGKSISCGGDCSHCQGHCQKRKR